MFFYTFVEVRNLDVLMGHSHILDIAYSFNHKFGYLGFSLDYKFA